MLRDHQLSQMQHDTTREDKVLDLFCTNKRSLVKAMTTVPGISDHDAIVADCDVQPAYIKKKPRSIIPLLKSKLVRNEKWCHYVPIRISGKIRKLIHWRDLSSLKAHIATSMETHIPSKITSKRQSLPWLTGDPRRRNKCKHRMYKKCKARGSPEAKAEFKKIKKETAASRREQDGNLSTTLSTRH